MAEPRDEAVEWVKRTIADRRRWWQREQRWYPLADSDWEKLIELADALEEETA